MGPGSKYMYLGFAVTRVQREGSSCGQREFRVRPLSIPWTVIGPVISASWQQAHEKKRAQCHEIEYRKIRCICEKLSAPLPRVLGLSRVHPMIQRGNARKMYGAVVCGMAFILLLNPVMVTITL
jgi:hypothetical protein